MKHTLFLAIFFFLLVFSSKANAQAWLQTNGPGGGEVKAVVANSQGHIFVLSNSLMRSTDDGASWTQLVTKIPSYVWDIRIKSTGELFAIAGRQDYDYLELWRSLDNGNTWTKLTTPQLFSLSIVPDGSLFITTSDAIPTYSVSIDNGDTWVGKKASVGEPINQFWGDKSAHLFFSTESNFYRSTDNGENWSKVVNGIAKSVFSFAEAPNGSLYAGVEDYDYSSARVLFKSTDGGRIWLNDTLNTNYFSIVTKILINSSGRIAISNGGENLLISDDAGKNWRFYGIGDGSKFLTVSNSGIFYRSSGSSLFRSTLDTGSKWKNFIAPNGHASAVIRHPNGNLLSANGWLSTDGGQHWNKQGGGGVPLALDSTLNILAGSGGSIASSTDAGLTWKSNSSNLTQGTITGLNVRNKGEIFASSSSEGVFRSTDNGLTWDQEIIGMINQQIFSLAVHQNGDVYAGSQNIIYQSKDIGLTWKQLTTNFPVNAGNVTALVVSTQGNIIAGIENAGVYWSTDNGTTWSQKALGLTAKHINALVSTPSGKVFAATEGGIFFLDIIPGANWIQLNSGLTATNVLSLCRDQSGRLFAGTDVSGVFSSVQTFNIAHPNGSLASPILVAPANGAVNISATTQLQWNSVPDAQSYQITISRNSDFSTIETMSDYLAGTNYSFTVNDLNTTFYWRVQAIGNDGISLYSETWSFTTASNAEVQQKNAIAAGTSLASNYPNPFSVSTTIPFSIGERSNITLEIVDPLGRTRSVLANGNYDAGSYEAKFNADDLSSGMYFLRLRTQKESFTKAIEILK